MDPASCRVIYIDDRFAAERWLTREMFAPSSAQDDRPPQLPPSDVNELPMDLQANVDAILAVFNQVFICNSGRSFSVKLAETHESVKPDCSPIFALFDVDSDIRHDHRHRIAIQNSKRSSSDSPNPRSVLQRQMTFSSEADECYGLQLLSRISSDLQVKEGIRLVIPVALVRTARRDSTATSPSLAKPSYPSKDSHLFSTFDDELLPVDSHMMLQCLDAGALDVVSSPLNNEKILGLTVHAYQVYKTAKKEQSAFLASASNFLATARRRQQSWVGIEEEKPYAYLREAMVKKLLKGICEPETAIEDRQHGEPYVEAERRQLITEGVGKWAFCAHDFSEDELVHAGCCMLNHALSMPELEHWRMNEGEILRFMQASRVAYNSFVLYHNFRHAVDVMQSLFYFLVQIGTVPPYPLGSTSPPLSHDESPIARLLHPFEALTLLICAVGHDVGHPGVNNMFLVKLNAPLAQLYNDQSVLEAFHCAAFSQILRRHWPAAFADKSMRKLLISSILATDMGVHPEYMQQLGNLQEKIHESKTTDGWPPKDVDSFRILVCGLLIKCADISNVARPWTVAEKWTHLLQQEFASQGEMEKQIGMETALFGGPPDIGHVMKLASGQVGFMTIFAHPLFANVTDVIPAMGFAAAEIMTNKGIWITKIEQEKRKEQLRSAESFHDGDVSPRSQTPSQRKFSSHKMADTKSTGYFPASGLRFSSSPLSPLQRENRDQGEPSIAGGPDVAITDTIPNHRVDTSLSQVPFEEVVPKDSSGPNPNRDTAQRSSGVFPSRKPHIEAAESDVQARKSSNMVPRSLEMNGTPASQDQSTTTTVARASSHRNGEDGDDYEEKTTEEKPPAQNLVVTTDPSTYRKSMPNQATSGEGGCIRAGVSQTTQPVLQFSTNSPTSGRQFPQTQSPGQIPSRISLPSNTDSSSLATSGGQTFSTNMSSNLSPSTALTGFLNGESPEELVTDRENGSWLRESEQGQDRDRVNSSSGTVQEGTKLSTMDPAPAIIDSEAGRSQTKSAIKSSTTSLRESEQESVSTYEGGDGEGSVRRRMNRFKFWKKRANEEDER